MKQPRPKPHIVISEGPLQESRDQVALCGKPIKKAAWIWTEGELCTISEWLEKLFGACQECKRMFYLSGSDLDVVHVYGAIDGESAKQGQMSE